MGGGHDHFEGGTGAWTDTIHVDGAGHWTISLDNPGGAVPFGSEIDCSAPASRHIQFADGGEIDFQQIERLTWSFGP